MEHAATPLIVDVVRPAPRNSTPWSSVPPTSSSRRKGRRHGGRRNAACFITVATWSWPRRCPSSMPSGRHLVVRCGGAHQSAAHFVKPEPRKTTTWSTPRRHPPSMSSSWSRGGRRHGVRHDASHRRCRQAGVVKDDDMEHAMTPPTVDVVKPEPQKTTTWSTPRRRPPSTSSSRSRGRR
ncbi:hypothetical protein D1007_38588 [Hordeum vulgare]|nr:hypothetical protein D1007_38588 [Hordeum vulgare]